MLCALSLGIIVNYAPQNPQPVTDYAIDFFSSRIKVANALLGIVMVVIWYLIFNLQGIYRFLILLAAACKLQLLL